MFKRFNKKPYTPDYVKKLAREMRKNPTPGERKLWYAMKRKDYFGYRFRRQRAFGRYIFDFLCTKKKLVIEVDGASHIGKEEYDAERDKFIDSWQLKVLHFKEGQVLENVESSLEEIHTALKAR